MLQGIPRARHLGLIALAGCKEPSAPTVPAAADATISAIPDATISAIPDATISAISDATISAIPDATIPVEAGDSGCVASDDYDVTLSYAYVGPTLIMTASSPKAGIKVELARLQGPVGCQSKVAGNTLEWSCNEDMGILYGDIAVDGSFMVFRSAHDAFAVGPTPGRPPPKETTRKPWPCNARAIFHARSYSDHP